MVSDQNTEGFGPVRLQSSGSPLGHTNQLNILILALQNQSSTKARMPLKHRGNTVHGWELLVTVRNQEVPYFTISVLSIFLIVNRLLRKPSISTLLSKQTCRIGSFFFVEMWLILSLWVRFSSLPGSHLELTSLYTGILMDILGTNATM